MFPSHRVSSDSCSCRLAEETVREERRSVGRPAIVDAEQLAARDLRESQIVFSEAVVTLFDLIFVWNR